MRFVSVILFILSAFLLNGCSGSIEPASPTETFKTYVKATKKKDITTMKLLLSSESKAMHEKEAKAQNVTLDDIVKRQSLIDEGQTTVEFRNEKIEGDKATLEVKNSADNWEVIPFVKENGEWKIDKRGFADQILMESEQKNREMDNIFNQGRQP
jgi:hypothetical protein